ncbi:MAG: putative Ig domain-containing protein, partial [Candidatus Doudnabacteria bacterium]|nr:putative Ig domain-containing protein [Candidatus Doudnabacteria bacterium]
SNVASAYISGSSLYVNALTSGSTNIYVCQNNSSNCATLYVTVSGGSCGYYGCGTGTGSLYFNTASLPVMVIGQYYSYQLQTTGGSYPYNYYVSSGSLPYGLSLSSSGLISGVPNSTNTSTFTVRVSDNYGRSATANFTIGTTGGGLNYPGGVLGASAYASGRLIKENGTVYIVYKNTKTGFISASVFTGLGFKFSNVSDVGSSGLVDSGYTVRTAAASHPWGAWIKSGSTIYFVHESGLIPVADYATFINNGGQDAYVVNANTYDFRLPMLSVMTYSDSRLQ